MSKTHSLPLLGIITTILLMPACHSSKQTKNTISATTTIATLQADSIVHQSMVTHQKTVSITYIPISQIPLTPDSIPDAATSIQNLTNHLIYNGGGTIIIKEETTQKQDQTTTTIQTSVQDTTTTQNINHNEAYTQPPRASPMIDNILYILIAAAILILMARCRIKH
ncbi:MAG: hypothetical protein IK038_13430 [Bacteroidaceae bacterium]|nr:hypothetical protein [Bacteroidaceae bacterium]